MPTYQYRCRNCGHELEEFQSMTEDPLVTCPACSTDNLVRVMGAGAGLIFRGTGFYLTDYKNPSKKGPDTSSSKPPSGGGSGAPPSGTKD